MVTVPGADFSNTWPPSAALVCFGLASCLLAVAAAPKVSQLLEGSHRAWSVVAGANAVTMTVYLWHFTAITVAAGAFHALGWLPTAPTGTATWWVQKLPLVAAAFVVLAGLVAVFGPRERAGLLSGSSEGGHLGTGPVVGVAVALAVGFECWTSAQGRLPLALGGIGLLLAARQVLVRPPRQAVQHGNPTPAKVDAKTNA